MSTCLVTGGAGFIGAHLVEALVGEGHTVRVLDNLSTGYLANLAGVRERIEFTRGDVCDLEVVRRVSRGTELVFHLAAIPSILRSVADPLGTHHACATGTHHVLTAALESEVRRVIYAASSSAYGNSTRNANRETDPTAALSPYSVGKLAGEQSCKMFSEVYGLETVCLRFFHIFGPRQESGGPYAGVIPLFIETMLDGTSPVIYGDGSQTRDFTYVENAVRAAQLAATVSGAGGQVFNVACGRSVTLLDLVSQINELLDTQIEPEFAPVSVFDIGHSLANISRARTGLGYEPVVDFEAGLARCVEYHRNRRAAAVHPARHSKQRNGKLSHRHPIAHVHPLRAVVADSRAD